MAPLLDIDLKQIAQVIQRRAGAPEMPLLLDGGWLGVDQPAQGTAVFPRYLLPGRLAAVIAKGDGPPLFGFGQKDAPTVVRHFDIAKVRPAIGLNTDGGAQVDIVVQCTLRSEFLPPAHIAWLPSF